MNNASVWKWLAWMPAVLFVLYQFLLQTSTSVMVPQLMCDLRLSLEQVGILSAAFFYPYVILQIPSGWLVDRLGPRKTLIISLVICLVAATWFSCCNSHAAALLSRILMGIASAPAVVCAMCLAARSFPSQRFGMLAGVVESVGMLGGALGQYALAHLVVWFSWRWAMGISAMVALLLLLAVIILVRPAPKQEGSPNCLALPQVGLLQALRQVMCVPQIWWNCVYAGLMFSVVTAFAALWSVPLLMHVYTVDATVAAFGSALIFLGIAVGAVLAGWLADRLGCYRLLMLMFASAAAALMAIVLYGCWIPLHGMFVVLFLLGVSVGAYVLPFSIVKRIIKPHMHGVALAFTNMLCILLGAPILQPLMGWMLGSENVHACAILPVTNYQFALSPLVIVLLLAVLVVGLIRVDQ